MSTIRSFFRIVHTNPPGWLDFASHRVKKGTPRADLPAELRRIWDGVSVYDTEERARRLAKRRRYLGRFIAEVQIIDGGPIRYEKTTDDPHHYTLWADPDEIWQSVVRVAPVRGSAESGGAR